MELNIMGVKSDNSVLFNLLRSQLMNDIIENSYKIIDQLLGKQNEVKQLITMTTEQVICYVNHLINKNAIAKNIITTVHIICDARVDYAHVFMETNFHSILEAKGIYVSSQDKLYVVRNLLWNNQVNEAKYLIKKYSLVNDPERFPYDIFTTCNKELIINFFKYKITENELLIGQYLLENIKTVEMYEFINKLCVDKLITYDELENKFYKNWVETEFRKTLYYGSFDKIVGANNLRHKIGFSLCDTNGISLLDALMVRSFKDNLTCVLLDNLLDQNVFTIKDFDWLCLDSL